MPGSQRGRQLVEVAAEGFGKSEREESGGEKGGRLEEESRSETEAGGEGSNGERRNGGEAATDVVAETHGGSANFSGEDFAGDGGIAGEEAGAEEGDERSEDEEPEGAVGDSVERHERGGDDQVGEIRFAAAEGVSEESEERVTQPFSRGKDDKKGGGFDEAEAAAALGYGQGKISGNPSEKSPVTEHAAGVHGGGQKAVAEDVALKQAGEDGRPGLCAAALPNGRFGNAAPDPEEN